jgi:hypothetical protein
MLKPQDIPILLKTHLWQDRHWRYSDLAETPHTPFIRTPDSWLEIYLPRHSRDISARNAHRSWHLPTQRTDRQ